MMDLTERTAARVRRVRVRRAGIVRRIVALALVATAAVAAAACGGTSQAATTTGSSKSGQTVQTMTTVKRGDLVATLTGKVTLEVSDSTATASTTFTGTGAADVATGQTVTLVFMRGGTTGQGSGSASSPRPTAAPSAPSGSGGAPSGVGPSGAPNASGGAASGAQGGMGGTTAKGTVTSVRHSGSMSATVQIAIAKPPTGVTAKSVGMAGINAGVLARNVLLVPTAAIKGSGDNASVQVVANGKTTTTKVVVGTQTRAESEIVSGLSVGDNVVYERTGMSIPGAGGGAGGGAPQGQGPPATTGSSN